MSSASNPVTPQFHFEATAGNAVTQDLLEKCAELFSTNYGVWGEMGKLALPPVLPGKRVKMSAARLRTVCLSAPESTVLVTCRLKGSDVLVGHAFATVWKFDGGIAGWVTQLVVHASVRRQNIATNLLRTLKSEELFRDITAIGLASSHPASVNALVNYSYIGIDVVDTDFISRNARKILAATPVSYLKPQNATLHGSLFYDDCKNGVLSCVDTKFFVDHHGPLEVLDSYKKSGRWRLGELLEGHEFLIIIPVEKSSDS